MDQTLYNELNKAWKTTCKVVLGDELGELKEYESWLKEEMPPIKNRKSHMSGKEVVPFYGDYGENAKFISFEESRDITTPININDLKDIDSILRAVSEKWEYVGNVTTGKTTACEGSSLVQDSNYVAESRGIAGSNHVAYTTVALSGSHHVFGSDAVQGEFLIKQIRDWKTSRCFGSHFVIVANDTYSSSNCWNCSDIMFSFNIRNKRNCIGNLELPKEKYAQLKKKLLSEMRDEIKKNKRFPSVMEMIPDTTPQSTNIPKQKLPETHMELLDKAFSSTAKVLFKKELGPLKAYESWLSKYIPLSEKITSPFSNETYLPSSVAVRSYQHLPRNRIVSPEESFELGKITLTEKEVSSLEGIKNNITKIGYITCEGTGQASNAIDCTSVADVSNLYRCERVANLDNCAFCFLTFPGKNIFGMVNCANDQFSMRCFGALNVNRCFETDSCSNCSDTYFAHNCEGLQDCMFCFNTKAKRYAIGNTQLDPNQYRKIKDAVLLQLGDELEKNKELKLDIFNVGCAKRWQ